MQNIIYIGHKETVNYIMTVQTMINNGIKEIIVKARGKSISKAVDTVERAKQSASKDILVKDIIISTEQLQNNSEGSGDPYTTNVSAIEIILTLKEKEKSSS